MLDDAMLLFRFGHGHGHVIKPCSRALSFHFSVWSSLKFVPFGTYWIDGLGIGKALRAQLARIQRI